jgi:glucosamine--fructose-6-phosphate aminotransferase (isomerizing)
MMAFLVGNRKGSLDNETYRALINELSEIPGKIEKILGSNDFIRTLAERFADRPIALPGQRISFPGGA